MSDSISVAFIDVECVYCLATFFSTVIRAASVCLIPGHALIITAVRVVCYLDRDRVVCLPWVMSLNLLVVPSLFSFHFCLFWWIGFVSNNADPITTCCRWVTLAFDRLCLQLVLLFDQKINLICLAPLFLEAFSRSGSSDNPLMMSDCSVMTRQWRQKCLCFLLGSRWMIKTSTGKW